MLVHSTLQYNLMLVLPLSRPGPAWVQSSCKMVPELRGGVMKTLITITSKIAKRGWTKRGSEDMPANLP